jgi:YHS domain-containing protein/thiol-disulfide isomerase/thioredoxin
MADQATISRMGFVMTTRSLLRAALLAGLLAPATLFADQVPWASDLVTAQRLAAERNLLILVHFTADDCAPCRRLEKHLFSDRSFAYDLSQKFVPVKINASRFPELARQFGVQSWPTDVVLAPNGQEIHRMVSPQDRNQYLGTLGQIAWRHQTVPQGMSLAKFPITAPPSTNDLHTPPLSPSPQPHVSGTTSPVGNVPTGAVASSANDASKWARPASYPQVASTTALASSNHLGYNPPSQSNPSGSSAFPAQGGVEPSPPGPANPTATASSFGGPAVQYVQLTPSAGRMTPSGSGASVDGSFQPQDTWAWERGGGVRSQEHIDQPAPHMVTNEYALSAARPTAGAPPVPTSVPTRPAAESAVAAGSPESGSAAGYLPGSTQTYSPTTTVDSGTPISSQVAAPPVPPRETRLGMEGYCPVSLFEDDEWVRGDTQWGVRHRGRVYLFQSAAAQQRFLENPDRYAPLLAGYDPVIFSEQGTYSEGYRAHGIRYEDHIILFASEETLEQFSRDPRRYVPVIYQAMNHVDRRGG